MPAERVIESVCSDDACQGRYPFSTSSKLQVTCSDCMMAPLKLEYTITGLQRQDIEKGPKNMWRYLPFLPVSIPQENSPLRGVGYTDLIKADHLGSVLGFEEGCLYIKADEGTITQTFKDRGMSVVGQYVAERNQNGQNYKAIGGTSTGNLASSIAAVAKLLGLKSVIIVPESTEEGLINKTLAHGAYVLRVEGDYSRANAKVNAAINDNETLLQEIAWANIKLRQVYSQGSKTLGLEIPEQLGWKVPAHIVHPVAAGLSLWQIYEGLRELNRFDLIDSMHTQMHGVQTKKCNPVVDAWQRNSFEINPIRNPGRSVAETLCVPDPSNGIQVLQVLKESNGSAVAVSEEEIYHGMSLLREYTGLRESPVAGAVIAGLADRVRTGRIKSDEITVAVLTDSGRSDVVQLNTELAGKLIDLPSDQKRIQETLEGILQAA